MPKPTQAHQATLGIQHARCMLSAGQFGPDVAHYIAALCDYAQAQIEARSKGGRTMTEARRASNKLNASKPRKRKQKIIQ